MPLWDTTLEAFSGCGIQRKSFYRCGIQRRGYPPMWDTTEEDFFRCGIHRRTISQESIPLYPTPQQNLIQCTVSQKNLQHYIPQRAGFLPLYPTMEDIFLRCGIQRKRFFSLWDTKKEEAFLHCGIQRKRFFPLWDTKEKSYTTQNDIFKCLSLPSNKNLGKIS